MRSSRASRQGSDKHWRVWSERRILRQATQVRCVPERSLGVHATVVLAWDWTTMAAEVPALTLPMSASHGKSERRDLPPHSARPSTGIG